MDFFEFLKNEVIYDDGDVRVEIAGCLITGLITSVLSKFRYRKFF